MATAADKIKATALQVGLEYLTGYRPQVLEDAQKNLILRWSDADAPKVSAMLARQFKKLSDQPPGPVRVDFAPVLKSASFSLWGDAAILTTAATVGGSALAGYLLGSAGK